MDNTSVDPKVIVDNDTIAGPNLAGLIAALTRKSVSKPSRELLEYLSVTITTQNGRKMYVIVNMLLRDDGSGESWVYEGYVVRLDDAWINNWLKCKGFINTQTRKGHIKVTTQ